MVITEKDTAAQAKDMAGRIVEAEKGRHAGLQLALPQLAAKVESLRLERIRLAYKYGADHLRVKELDVRLAAAVDDYRDAAGEHQRSSIQQPRPGEGLATLHGRVIDGNQLGVQGLTVRARLAEGSTEIGKTGTNEAGHFVFTFRQENKDVPHVAVLIEVLSSNCRVAYRDSWPRQIPFGSIEYVEIDIGSAEKPGRPPTPPGRPDEPSAPSAPIDTAPEPARPPGPARPSPPRPSTPRGARTKSEKKR